MASSDQRSLETQRVEFPRNRFLAMPLAGVLVWSILLITGAWFLLPDQQYTAVPMIVIACYLFTIPVLEIRWRRLNQQHG